jgi:hypothetical protein
MDDFANQGRTGQSKGFAPADVLAIKALRGHDCELGIASQLAVEVRPPSVTHTVTVQNGTRLLDGSAKSPKEKVMNESLKRALSPRY